MGQCRVMDNMELEASVGSGLSVNCVVTDFIMQRRLMWTWLLVCPFPIKGTVRPIGSEDTPSTNSSYKNILRWWETKQPIIGTVRPISRESYSVDNTDMDINIVHLEAVLDNVDVPKPEDGEENYVPINFQILFLIYVPDFCA